MTTTTGLDQERIAVERARRMRETWEQMQPSPGEIAAARARMVRSKGARRARGRVMPVAVAIAIVLAGAAAFAGVRTGVLRGLLRHGATVAPEAPPVPAVNAGSKGAPRVSTAAPPVASQQTVEPPTVDLESLPMVVEPPPSSRGRTGGTASSSSTGTSGAAAPPAAPAPAPAPSSSSAGWTAAVEALRSGDYGSADRAFGDLTTSSDPRTRDEARLARAQVWVAQGRVADARRELEQLASVGATPLVRTRATDMLRAMRSGSPDHDPPGTNSP